MKKLTFDNHAYGKASVAVGLVSIALWPTGFLMQAHFLWYVAPMVAVVGLVLAALAIKVPSGAVGIFLNVFGVILSVFTILGIQQLNLHIGAL